MLRLRVSLAVALFAAPFTATAVPAQQWPAHPLTMTVAFPAGGSDDILGRILAARMSEILGQPIHVQNVSGGGGTTGALQVANATPDGYSFLLGSSATHAISQAIKKAPYDAVTDFSPVTLLAEQPFVLIARPDFPANDLTGFAAHAKANSGGLRYSSAGQGSATHLVCALLDAELGIKSTHAPSNGGAAALQQVASGQVDHFCPVVTIAIPQIQKQTVKAIAVLSADRSSVIATVPTASEQGLGRVAVGTWFGLFLPKQTPPAVVQELRHAAAQAMDTPVVQARLKEIGASIVEPARRSPEYLREFLVRERKKWVTALGAANIGPE